MVAGLAWGSLLAAVFGGGLYTTDVQAELEVAGSLLGERPFLTAEHGWGAQGADGSRYTPHGIGYSLLLLPAAACGRVAGEAAALVSTGVLNALFSMVLFVSWLLLARRYAGGRDAPLYLLVAAACGLMLPVYGRMPYDVTAAAMFASLAILASLRGRTVTAGLLLGFSLLVRLDSLVFFPAFLGRGWRKRAPRILPGVLLAVLVTGAVNLHRFGSVLEDGHSQDPAVAVTLPFDGLAGLLVSPGKGLSWYAPVAVLAVAAALKGRDRRIYLAPFVLALVLHSPLHDWSGGTGWGPRFLFPTLPLLSVPLVASWVSPGAPRRWTAVPLAWGILATAAAVWTHPTALEQELGADLFDTPSRREVLWNPSRSPLVHSLGRLGRGGPDLFAWRAAEHDPGLLAPLAAAQLGFAGVLASTAVLLSSRERRRRGKGRPAGQ